MLSVDQVKAWLASRQNAYRGLFRGRHAPVVLADLAKFCRATETTYHENERLSGVLEGRREVWLRIQNHLNMSQDELYKLTTGQPAQPRRARTDSEE